MSFVLLLAGVVLLGSIVAGLVFVTRARSGAEMVLAALLLGTTGVALILVLARALGLAHGTDVALVLALLAAVLGVTFVMRSWHATDGENRR